MAVQQIVSAALNVLDKKWAGSSMDLIIVCMEAADKLNIPGGAKATQVVKTFEQLLDEGKLSGTLAEQIQVLINNGMLVPIMTSICNAAKQVYQINRRILKKKCTGCFG